MTNQEYFKLGIEYRRAILDMVVAGGRGHIGSAFSMVEIFSVLFHDVMKFDPKRPEWPDRDRLILSKGHGCLALYAFLGAFGFFSKSEYQKFCHFDGILGGHPDHRKIPGVEASTGSLGHGLSIGIGMAMAARLHKTDYRTYVILGDGECNEGSIWEGALAAAKHRLDNLVVLVDYNKIQSYAKTEEVLNLEPFAQKWESFGFHSREVDMNRPEELRNLLIDLPLAPARPHAIICHTIKGKGIPFIEHNVQWHHKSKLSAQEIERLYRELEG